MKRLTALILLVGVLLLALPLSASASTTADWQPDLYDLTEFAVADRPTDAAIISEISNRGNVTTSDVHYYKVKTTTRTMLVVQVGKNTNSYQIEATGQKRFNTVNTSGLGGVEIGTVMPANYGISQYTTFTAGMIFPLGNPQITNVETVTEIPKGFIIPFTGIKIVSVTATSATVSWPHTGNGDYQIRLMNPTGGDLANNNKIIAVPRTTGGSEQVYTLTGLKPMEQYGVYVSVGGGTESNRNFTTDTTNYTLKAFMGGEQLTLSASTKVSAYSDLEVRSSDWTRFDVYVNDTLIKTVNDPQASTQILLTEFQSKIDANLGANIEIRTYRNGETTVATKFSFHASSFNFAVGETPAGLMPHIPTKPDSNWDLVGWFKYGVDWLIYLVESVVWLLASVAGLVQTVWTGSAGFISMLGGVFSFMPKEVTALMVLGMGLAVILRVFGR